MSTYWNHKFSMLFVSGDRRAIRRWEGKRWCLGVAGLALGVLLLGFGFSTVGMIHYWKVCQETREVRVRNAQFDQERAALRKRIDQLAATVEEHERLVARLEQQNTIPPSGQLMEGIGPISESLRISSLDRGSLVSDFTLRTDRFTRDISLGKLDERVDDLDNRAMRTGDRMKRVYRIRQQRNAFWAALPSDWPVRGWVTSPFGPRHRNRVGGTRFHEGIDIAAPVGSPVIASGDGVVVFAGYKGGFGKAVIIDHGFGLSTLYGHNSKIEVAEGDRVHRGMEISRVGMTGRTTGPHLHYETLVDGVPVDPMRYLASRQ